MHSRKRAFTLMELLVVISIIAILAALALPALQGALNSAKKARANTMCQQLKVAVTAFNTEYGTWPGDTSQGQVLDNAALYDILSADNLRDGPKYNPRNIQFMEFTTKDLDNAKQPTKFIDPWYTSNKQQALQNYQVNVDHDFDGQLTELPAGANDGPTTLTAPVAVWDPGPPDKNGTVNAGTSSSIIKTW